MYLAAHRNPFPDLPDSIVEKDRGLLIGASITFGDLFEHPTIQRYHGLQMALRTMVNPTSRRQKMLSRVLLQDVEVQGTAAALMALDTRLVVVHPKGERTINLLSYFSQEGAGLKPGETVRSFFIPDTTPIRSVYQSIDFRRSGQAVCGVAIGALLSQDILDEVRIVLSGCTNHPVHLTRLSAAMQGKECTPESIDEGIRKLGEERLTLYNPALVLGSNLFNLSKTLIKRAILTL